MCENATMIKLPPSWSAEARQAPTSPLRILFLAPQPLFRLRGMCLAHQSCLRALSAAGAEIDVVCYPFGQDLAISGVRMLRLPAPPGVRDIPIGPSRQKLL